MNIICFSLPQDIFVLILQFCFLILVQASQDSAVGGCVGERGGWVGGGGGDYNFDFYNYDIAF